MINVTRCRDSRSAKAGKQGGDGSQKSSVYNLTLRTVERYVQCVLF